MENSKKYLEHVAEMLWSKHGETIEDLCIILPSRRMRLFLTDALRKVAGRTFWTPKFYSKAEFFSEVSGYEMLPPLRQLLVLYDLYKSIASQPDAFGDFVKWAPVALNDFSDLDASLSDAKKVFSDLRNIREIENWSFNEENLSEGQKKFLVFWEELGALHQAFREWQHEHNCYTYGALIHQLCEDPEIHEKWADRKTYWLAAAGLTDAELKLIKSSGVHESIEIIPDIDEYYCTDEQHEAGKVFRGAPFNTKWITNRLSQSDRTIDVYECATSYTQTIQTAKILSELTADELRNTAVILADDQLLEQMMSALTGLPVSLNISMGIPVFRTPAGRWIQSLIKCFISLRLDRASIHYRWFAQCMNYSFEGGMGDESCHLLLKKLIEKNWNFISSNDLEGYGKEFPTLEPLMLTVASNDAAQFLHNAIALLNNAKPQSEWASASVVKLKRILENLSNDIQQYPVLTEDRSLTEFLFMLMQRERIHFEGEPVDGLQILSLNETQGIDFKHAIIVGASEDYLPGKNFDQTFLPSDLRAHYGMPIPADREAMPSYLFWRLLQGTEKLYLLFPAVSSDFRISEQSRYITQLFTEFPASGYTKKQQHTVNSPAMMVTSGSVTFDDFCRKRVLQMFENGISPSAINKFNACPLDFYYRYILGLGEQEELEEQMSSASFGLIIHKVLEDFYTPFKGSAPTLHDFNHLKDHTESYVSQAAAEKFHTTSVKYGYNRLAIEMAGRILKKYIALEISALSQGWKVIALETNLKREVITVPPLPFVLNVKGTADRIDSLNGVHRILDYKTGKVKETDYILKEKADLEDVLLSGNSGKLIQLLLYRYMYKSGEETLSKIDAGFYSFSGIDLGYKMIHAINEEFFDGFDVKMSNALATWAKEVLSTETLQHNPSSRFCAYCR